MEYEGKERRVILNGDAKVIIDVFLKSIDSLERKMDATTKAIANSDCKAHAEVLRQFKDHLSDGKMWRGIIVGVVLSLFGFAVAWGSLKSDVYHLGITVEKLDKSHGPKS